MESSFHTTATEMIAKNKKIRKKRNETFKGNPTNSITIPLTPSLVLARDSGRSPAGNDPPSKLAPTLLRITRHMSPLSPRRIPDDFSRFIPGQRSWSVHLGEGFARRSSSALFRTLKRRKIVCRTTNGTWSGYLGERPLYQYEGKPRAKPGLYPKDVRKKDPMASSHNLEVLDR